MRDDFHSGERTVMNDRIELPLKNVRKIGHARLPPHNTEARDLPTLFEKMPTDPYDTRK